MSSPNSLDKSKIANTFSRSAASYDKFSGLQKSLAKELSEKIKALNIDPKRILDIGTGTGELAFLLHDIFKGAKITGCDIAEGMIEIARSKNKTKEINFDVADAEKLPYLDGAFDLVVSSTSYQWIENLKDAFKEASRVLKTGYFIFLTFGPDSLMELKKAYKLNVDEKAEYFHEYHTVAEIGRILEISTAFRITSLTSRIVKTVYPNLREMLKTIKGIGALNASIKLPKGLRSKSKIKKMTEFYEANYRTDKNIYATYEIIEAICLKT